MADDKDSANLDLEENEDQDVEEIEDAVTEDSEEDEEQSEESIEATDDEEESAEDDEYTSDFEEWKKDHGLSEDIDSFETLAERHKAAIDGMNKAQNEAAELRSRTAPPPETPRAQTMSQVRPLSDGESYFGKSPVGAIVTSMIETGRIPDENKASYKMLAQVVDPALDDLSQKAEQVMTVMAQQMQGMREAMNRMQWDTMPTDIRGAVNRSEVEKLLSNGLFDSMDEALKYLSFKNPDMLKNMAKQAEERGKKKAQKKFRKNRAMRKGKPGPTGGQSWDYGKYMSHGEWDHAKLGNSNLTTKQKDQMFNAFMKEHGIEE